MSMRALVTILALLCATPIYADTLVLSLTLTTADIDRIVAAYQSAANTSVNGTATRAQVLAYIKQKIVEEIKNSVSTFEQAKAIEAVKTPAPINPQ